MADRRSKTSGPTRELRELTKRLAAARALEAKRLRQSAKAHQKVDKRERQAARAAAKTATILARIEDLTRAVPEPEPAPLATRARPPAKPRVKPAPGS
jgi:hypothetical protein